VILDPETLDLLSECISTHNVPEFQADFTLSSVQVWNIVKKYGRMINVDIHPHTFRHSFAIHLVRSGLDLRRVQQLLGHSNLNAKQVYLQFKDEDLREGFNKIEF
jgi:integrase/recombinase XerD